MDESEFSYREHRAISRGLCKSHGLPRYWLHRASLPGGLPDLDHPTALVVLMLMSPPELVVVDTGDAYRAQLGLRMSVEHPTPGRAVADLLRMGA
jgi:hypothetical protein